MRDSMYEDIDMNEVVKIQRKRLDHIINQNERSKKWKSIRKNKTRIAKYYTDNSVDGPGIRNSLYVTYCPFQCLECYNKSIQDYNQGSDWSEEFENQVIEDLDKPYVSGLSILGGEPVLNAETLVPMIKKIREKFGETKNIWIWSGFLYEVLIGFEKEDIRYQMLELVDVLVDGQYIKEYRDESNPPVFRGSSNQRIIDIQASLKEGKTIELIQYYNP